MAINYKNSLDLSLDTLSKNANILNLYRGDDFEKPKSYFEANFEKYQDEFTSKYSLLQNIEKDTNKSQDALIYMKRHGFILQNDQIVQTIIESGTFTNILSLFKNFPSDVLDCLLEMVSCSFDIIILLLKNNIGSVLIEGLKCEDDEIFQKSMKCFSIILSKRSESYDYNAFLYCITLSTNILEIVIERLKGKELNDSMKKTFMNFAYFVFEKIPIKDEIQIEFINELLVYFFSECLNSGIFNPEIFNKIIQNKITFSEDNEYYQLLFLSFTYAKSTDDVQIIYDLCHIIYTLFTYDISTCELIFKKFNFLDYSDKWVKKNDLNIFKMYSILIGYFLSESDIEHINGCMNKISLSILHIFDSSPMIKQDDILLYNITSLQNLIYHDNQLIQNLIDENRIAIICSNIVSCSHKVAKASAKLYLDIASIIDDFGQILNDEIMEKILGYMDKKKGEFVSNALNSFNMILEKQQKQNKNDMINVIMKLDGVNLIYDMIDSDDEPISQMSFNISTKYFPQN